jgi:pimeloyl-ACP methyl ester carboxylesterase
MLAVAASTVAGCNVVEQLLGLPPAYSENNKTIDDYPCNYASAEANAFRTAGYQAPPNFPVEQRTSILETVAVTIGGVAHRINVLSVFPRNGATNGLVVINHGLSSALATQNLNDYRSSDEYEWARRGYAVVYIARRGAMGSSGQLTGSVAGYTLEDFSSQRVAAATVLIDADDYQSASVVETLRVLATDARYQPFLHAMLLTGSSGGSFTSISAARHSAVFQAAPRRAVARITGTNSRDFYLDDLAAAADRAAGAHRADAVGVPTFWLAGEEDPISHPGQLACSFNSFTKQSHQADRFYLVPGMGHVGTHALWSPPVAPYFQAYMRGMGFATF